MRLSIFVLSLTLCSSAYAASDCTFDQENQVEVLQAMAKKHPGGQLDIPQRRITWTKGELITEFNYGGCVDFGSGASSSERKNAARSEQEIFRVAKDLARKYWDAKEAGILLDALNKQTYTIERINDVKVYNVKHENYVTFYVQHRFENNRDVVTINWQGNF